MVVFSLSYGSMSVYWSHGVGVISILSVSRCSDRPAFFKLVSYFLCIYIILED